MGRAAGSTVKGRRVKRPRSVIFRKIMEEKRRRRTTSTGSLDGTMITRDNRLVRLEASDSVANSLRVIPELEAEYATASEVEVRCFCVTRCSAQDSIIIIIIIIIIIRFIYPSKDNYSKYKQFSY